ncbi:MAG: hypothetical protein Q9195_009484 [Heterodermia aff. obscurata]
MAHVWVGVVTAILLWISNALVISHPHGSLFPDLNATAMEPASEHLSALNLSLGVPLNPTADMGFWARTTGAVTRAGPFRKVSLVACIVSMVAQFSWSEPQHVPITDPKTERHCRGMLFTIQPTLLPGADFTTYKAGMAFLILLRDLFSLSLWSRGHITAGIAKYNTSKAPHPWGLPIGVIYIEKIGPEVGNMTNPTASKDIDDFTPLISISELSNDSSAENSTNGFLADAKEIRETKWLGGYVRLVTYIFAKAWDSRVQSSLPAGQHNFPMVLHLRSDVNWDMESNITIVQDPGAMLWLSVLGAAIELCETAAANDRWDYREAISVALHGSPRVRLSIGPTWRPGPR